MIFYYYEDTWYRDDFIFTLTTFYKFLPLYKELFLILLGTSKVVYGYKTRINQIHFSNLHFPEKSYLMYKQTAQKSPQLRDTE